MKLCNTLFTINLPPPQHYHQFLYTRRPTTRLRIITFSSDSTQRVTQSESLQSETLKVLEWPSLCLQLSSFTSTSMGLAAARSARIPVGQTPDETRKLLAQTSAAVAVSRPLDFSGIEDVSPIVDAAVDGGMLSIREICSVKRMLRAARSLVHQLEEISLRSDFSES